MAQGPNDPNASRLVDGRRVYFYKGAEYSPRELYEHPDRTGDLTYEQFYARLSGQVRRGEMDVAWAMTHKVYKRCAHRDVDVTYLGDDLGAPARRVGQFMLRLQGGESHRKMARRAAEIASHYGAISGVYLISIWTKEQRSWWSVGVWSGEVGQPKTWDAELENEVNIEAAKQEVFRERW
jgi:hypothetical protein